MGNHNDKDILKFDKELEAPRSAVIENNVNVIPKKSEICSAAEHFSRYGQTSKDRIVKAASDRKN